MKGHGHVVAAVVVAIAGIIVILRALNLQVDDKPLQNWIFVVHGVKASTGLDSTTCTKSELVAST